MVARAEIQTGRVGHPVNVAKRVDVSQDLSPTAVICENLQRFGGTPQKGEPDPRAVWDRDEALAGLETILDTFADEIAPDGTQLADERESLLWGFVNTLHMQARRQAQTLLGRVAAGEDPAAERARARGLPTLGGAFEDYLAVNPNRSERTNILYRQNLRVNLSDWVNRPLNNITRRDVEARFHRITGRHGWAGANQTLSMLRSIYRRPCVDHEGLRNPVELWLAAGGRFHRHRRRRISAPSEVLPRWCAGIQAVKMPEDIRNILWIGIYTGMRLGEVTSLRWERIDLERLRAEAVRAHSGEALTGFLFPSDRSRTGHVVDVQRVYAAITEAGDRKFWFHGLRNSFISVAERELMLPCSLTKRLVNHARSGDVTEGYAADWTVEQLRAPAQRVADRIDELTGIASPPAARM